MSVKYSYTKQVNIINLKSEIEDSTITIALDYIEANSTDVDVYFKASLSASEETELSTIVTNHIYIDSLDENVITTKVQEEVIPTGGHFSSQTIGISTNSIGWHYVDFSWPVPISFLSAEYNSEEVHRGDIFRVMVYPDTIVGAITSDVSVSDTVINVQQSVLENVNVGFWVDLFDGTNVENLGRVISKDDVNNQITVETASTTAFAYTTPTYVRMSVGVIKDIYLYSPGPVALGESKIGGSHLGANKVMRLWYYNSDGVEKEFHGAVDYLY